MNEESLPAELRPMARPGGAAGLYAEGRDGLAYPIGSLYAPSAAASGLLTGEDDAYLFARRLAASYRACKHMDLEALEKSAGKEES